MDKGLGRHIVSLRDDIVALFLLGDWEELGLLTGFSDRITRHPRLLRSLHWDDSDYPGHALSIIREMIEKDSSTLPIIESCIEKKRQESGATYNSGDFAENQNEVNSGEKKIIFSPKVFSVPNSGVEYDLVAVMMPFAAEFDSTYSTISEASKNCGLRCLRADSIWEEATIIQDIFNLIYRAKLVIVDFSGRNPNVMYETGIAHTLGKQVIPICQNLDDIPFDMRHHRVLRYLPNSEGMSALRRKLETKLRQSTFRFEAAVVKPDPDPF